MQIENISKSFGSKVIADDVSFHFSKKRRYGLVGVNGAGKSSLLNLLCGIDEPDAGTVTVSKKEKFGYLPQEPNPIPQHSILLECMSGCEETFSLKNEILKLEEELKLNPEVEHFSKHDSLETRFRNLGGYTKESQARKILIGLGFSPDNLHYSPLTLSGGWRMRLELAKIFLQDPDIYILDEPTNHLDLPSMIFVEEFLKNSTATTIFVSHDSGLLNRLATDILHLAHGNLTHYVGNYASFRSQESSRTAMAIKERESLDAKIKELEGFAERFGAKATKAKQAQSKLKQAEKLRAIRDSIRISKTDKAIAIPFPKIGKSHREVLKTNSLSVGYDECLIKDASFLVERNDKIAIVGSNGKGKSTLLKTIMGEIDSISGDFKVGENVKTGYFAQNQAEKLDPNLTVIETFLKETSYSEKEARSILGRFLFENEDVFKHTKVLSGGEKNRLGLSILFSSNFNFMILDEPTNHLDTNSIEALEEVVSSYEGTILFVSHNQDFTNSVATKCLHLTSGKALTLYPGNLDDIERYIKLDFASEEKVETNSQKTHQPATSQLQVSESEIKEMQKLKRKLQNDSSKLEENISDLDSKIDKMNKALLEIDPGDYIKISSVSKEIEEIKSQKEESELTYFEKLELLEEIENKLSSLGRS